MRNCDTGEYLYASGTASLNLVKSHDFTETDVKARWKLISAETDVFYFQPADFTTLHMNVKGNAATDKAEIIVYTAGTATNEKFKLIRNGDGTFTIKTGSTGYSKALDGCPLEDSKSTVQQMTYTSGKLSQKWEFIPVSGGSPLYMSAENEYTGTKGNFLYKTKDGRGNTTTYAYNSSKGLLESVTTPNGATTTYSYDPTNDRLVQIQNGSAKVGYSYTKDRLSSIAVDGGTLRYQLNYDVRGRRTTTQVGYGPFLNTLSTNTWNSRDLLTKMTYGNGGQINYAYDNLDRVTKVWNADAAKGTEYVYNAQGLLCLLYTSDAADD